MHNVRTEWLDFVAVKTFWRPKTAAPNAQETSASTPTSVDVREKWEKDSFKKRRHWNALDFLIFFFKQFQVASVRIHPYDYMSSQDTETIHLQDSSAYWNNSNKHTYQKYFR